MSNHIVLYQPEIPANTRNISRTCAGTDTHLHLIRPLGFSTDDKMLKRAGLDYWKSVKVTYYDSLEEFFKKNAQGEYYFITKFGQRLYSEMDYSNETNEHYFIFGKETRGLPSHLLKAHQNRTLRIPMTEHIRALNLSNTAAIVIYEALRQQSFIKLELKPQDTNHIFGN